MVVGWVDEKEIAKAVWWVYQTVGMTAAAKAVSLADLSVDWWDK